MPKPMHLAEFTLLTKPLIDKRIRAAFRQQKEAAKLQNSQYLDLVNELSVLARRGGKRLRPLLCVLAYEGYGGRNKNKASQVAISLELLHTFLLIHDDIIDRDRHRWGGQNITGVYFERFSRVMPAREALHAAESRALLAGDICMAMANEALVASGFNTDSIIEAQHLLQQVSFEVISGQLADIANSQSRKVPTEQQILQTYRSKTASYSFRLPLQLGALFAGAEAAELQKLGSIADKLGVAFQLQDDLLGVFGSESQTGKSSLSDLREGKQTLLISKTLEQASERQRTALRSMLGNDSIGQAELQRAQQIIIECGARDYVRQLAATNVSEASQEIAATALGQVAVTQLLELSHSLINRSK